MAEMIKKSEFLEMIRSSHFALESLLAEFTQQQMEAPGSRDDWAVKDVIAHIAWYEAEMVNMLEQHALEGSTRWNLSLQERNSAIYAASKDESLPSVIEKETCTYQAMLKLLEAMEETALNDPAAFAGMPSEWQPRSVIASNTYEHYPEHIRQLKGCLRE